MDEQNRIGREHYQGMRPWHYLYILKNPIDFAIRNKVQWNYALAKKEKTLFSSILSNYEPPVKQAAYRLISAYHLDIIDSSFCAALAEVNLYYLDLFQTTFEKLKLSLPQQINVVDVGPSDWFYVAALVNFLRYYQLPEGRDLNLSGYEIDPYRVYDNFHARHNIASYRINPFDCVQYYKEPFSASTDTYDLVLQCFPFLFLKDHLSWGLPKSLFNPRKLLADVAVSLKKNGLLLIINQGKEENRLQKELLEETQLSILTEFVFTSAYKKYSHEHYMLVVKNERE
jgi:hypothetical protein